MEVRKVALGEARSLTDVGAGDLQGLRAVGAGEVVAGFVEARPTLRAACFCYRRRMVPRLERWQPA